MIDMQDKSGLIQKANVTSSDHTTTISQRERVNSLPTIDTNKISSQMTKSQTTMVNEATCSSADDMINSNENIITNDSNNMSTNSISSHATDQLSIRQQTQIQTQSQLQSQSQQQSYSNLSNNSNTASTNSNSTRPAKRTAIDYRFGKTIGEGSFSSVYIAQDIHTKKEVASKLFSHLNLILLLIHSFFHLFINDDIFRVFFFFFYFFIFSKSM